ncbi:MAG: acyltransferase [Rickettsiales bacterium]|nr:acyltransferase [Rickettsiales bacterium]
MKKIRKIFIKLFCCFVPFKELRHKLKFKSGENNKIIIIENNKEYIKPFWKKIEGLTVKINGNNNIVKIEMPLGKSVIKIFGNSDNNEIFIHKNIKGIINIGLHGENNKFEIGENTSIVSISIYLINNICKIGKNCMISDNVTIWGDGHSVIDVKTNKVLNLPKTPILIGDNVWLGERVTLTKNALVPDNCIVGVASVVAKKFDEVNCVLAGNPAKVVKTGIAWDVRKPTVYRDEMGEEYI